MWSSESKLLLTKARDLHDVTFLDGGNNVLDIDKTKPGVIFTIPSQAGIHVDTPNPDKRTALHVAVTSGSVEVLKILLSRGARTDLRDDWDQTPLHDAMRKGNTLVLNLLGVQK